MVHWFERENAEQRHPFVSSGRDRKRSCLGVVSVSPGQLPTNYSQHHVDVKTSKPYNHTSPKSNLVNIEFDVLKRNWVYPAKTTLMQLAAEPGAEFTVFTCIVQRC